MKPREVISLTQAVRAVHYRGMQIHDNGDDGSEYRFGREVAEYLDIEGYARRRIEQRAHKLSEIPREAG